MTPANDRELLQSLRTLARHEPARQAVERSIEAVRAKLLVERGGQRKHQRRLLRFMIPSGIAAVSGLVFALLWFNHSSESALAAEAVKSAAQTTSAYKGWLHLAVAQEVEKAAAGSDAVTKRAPKEGVQEHRNTIDGTLATVQPTATGKLVTLRSPATGEESVYASEIGEIEVRSMHPTNVKTLQSQVDPLTLAEFLKHLSAPGRRAPLAIQKTEEAGLDRYDFTLFKSRKEAEEFAKANGTVLMGDKISLWIDRRTGLFARTRYVPVEGVTVTVDYTYGKPEIRDIYDLGVPRTAKVVDRRLNVDLKTLLTRLDERALATTWRSSVPMGWMRQERWMPGLPLSRCTRFTIRNGWQTSTISCRRGRDRRRS
jgi:hypothetical protein